MKRLVIVGGGISGAAAAFSARDTAARLGQSESLEILLLEKERELGGKAQSVLEDGWLFESGPLGYLDTEPTVDELARGAGLEPERVEARSAQVHRFVFSRGKIREVRPSPIGFLTGGLLSPKGLLRAAMEPWIARKKDDTDESVWDFAARRVGPEFADRLIHPMVLGIFAGDAKRLSLAAAFPIMEELERDYGSLIRAQIARARARKRGELPPRRSALRAFRGGLQTLPRALVRAAGVDPRVGAEVAAVLPAQGRWRVAVGGESLGADAVILATEGFRTASILEEGAPEIADQLAGIPHPPIYVVALGYGAAARARIPEGFGLLLPRGVGYRALGVTWDGWLFPDRNAGEGLLVRVLFGGTFDPEVDRLPPEEVVALAVREMEALFALETRPVFQKARLWPSAIPQYELGHRERVQAVGEASRRLPGLYVAGNALHGTAFGKAAARGVECGADAARFLSKHR